MESHNTNEIIIPINITIESDLLLKIPDHIKSKIVESALHQLQKAYVTAWWKGDEINKTCEVPTECCKFSVQTHLHHQSFALATMALNGETGLTI